jgi:hypothetical protein
LAKVPFKTAAMPMGSLHQIKVKKFVRTSNPHVFGGVSFAMVSRRRQMRVLIFALVMILAGPSLAGSTDGDLPGVGTFSYSGSPIPAPQLLAAIGR